MRTQQLTDFLNQTGWGNARRTPLARDASFRSYERLTLPGRTAVLMNAPKPENPAQFVHVDHLLADAGARVPAVLASDLTNGFLILEDFGDDTFARLLDRGADDVSLYTAAAETLALLQRNADLPANSLPAYDLKLMLFEVSLFTDWYLKYVLKRELSDPERAEFTHIWTNLILPLQAIEQKIVLLDFHVDNLMITPDKQCGLLDFQDARLGPVTYDLISLTEDARRPVSNRAAAAAFEAYFNKIPEHNTPIFRAMCPITAVQRHTKVIGIFTRLCVRDNKDGYLKHIPFVWSLLEKHLNEPILAPYKAWLDRIVPPDVRRVIPDAARIKEDK